MSDIVKTFVLGLFLSFCLQRLLAQPALNMGYDYSKVHAGYLGGEYRLDGNRRGGGDNPLNIGLGAVLYNAEGKFGVIPEIHLNKSWKHFLITEISATTQALRPHVGLTLFNLVRFQFGYNVPFGKLQVATGGFYFGLRILIGSPDFYHEVVIF